MQKPADITYGLLDRPPFFKTILLALQQIFVLCIYLALISIVGKAAGMTTHAVQVMVSMGLFMMGVAVLLQAIHRGPIGSGFLVSCCPAVTYFAAEVQAAHMGGIHLVLGMIVFAGVCQIIFASLIKYLRVLFPPVVTGLIFCGIGLDVGIIAFSHVFGHKVSLSSHVFHLNFIAFLFTLCVILGLSIWGKGIIKLLCLILGLIVGSAFALFLGLFGQQSLINLSHMAFFSVSFPHYLGFSFSFELMPVFLIAALCAGLRTVGVMTSCQQINDANWNKPDQTNIIKGVRTDGLTTLLSGLVGTIGVGLSPSAVGVTKASGATSRVIAYAEGIICILLSFVPVFAGLFMALPESIIAAGLVVTSSIMFVGGIRIIIRSEIDLRKTYIIGISILVALSPKLFPQFFAQLPQSIAAIMNSMLVMMALSAIIINFIFHIGRKRRLRLLLEDPRDISEHGICQKAVDIGAPEGIAKSAAKVTHQVLQKIATANVVKENQISTHFTYNEIDLVIDLSYEGSLPPVPRKDLVRKDLVEEQTAFVGLLGAYQGELPDSLSIKSKEDNSYIKMVYNC